MSLTVAVALASGAAFGAVVHHVLATQARRRLRRAVERGDPRTLREAFDAWRPFFPATRPMRVAWEAAAEGLVLTAEERWVDARRVLETVDLDALGDDERAMTANALAWVLVHVGELDRAAELAASLVDDDPRAAITLAVARLRLGRAADALPVLERCCEAGGAPSSLWFYAGEAYRALGRAADAERAYAEVDARDTSGAWRARAGAARNGLDPYR